MKNREQKIKVLFVLPSLAPGGIERHFIRQVRYFNKELFKLSVATLFHYPEKSELYSELPEHIPYTIFRFKGYGDIRSLIAFTRFLRKEKPDIVVSSMFSANTLTRILGIFLGFQTIAREHNIYSEKSWWQRLVDRALSTVCYRVVPVSDDVAKFIIKQEKINPEKITVISNGIDIDEVRRELQRADQDTVRNELGMKKDEKLIINVARLKEQKDHQLLIRSFATFCVSQPNYHLAILGDGNERNKLEKLIKDLGIDSKIHIMGYRSDVYNFYATADFFVLSSKREGFPNVILESLACGVPVISTPVPGVGQIIELGKNGYIVQNKEELESAMKSMANLDPQSRKEFSEESRSAADKFSIQINVAHYEKLFQECISSKS